MQRNLKKVLKCAFVIVIFVTCLVVVLLGNNTDQESDYQFTDDEWYSDFPIQEETNTEENSLQLPIQEENIQKYNTENDNFNNRDVRSQGKNSPIKVRRKIRKVDVKKVEIRFRSRVSLLRKKCSQFRSTFVDDKKPIDSFFSNKYGLFVCPTVASYSLWQPELFKIDGKRVKTTKPLKEKDNALLSRISGKPEGQATSKKSLPRPRPTVRVLSVRHPIDRLIAAFKKKVLLDIKESSSNFMDEVAENMQQAFEEVEEGQLKPNENITFKHFLDAVIKEKKKSKRKMPLSWKPQYMKCKPCSLPYDYILKAETFDEDFYVLVNKFHIKELNPNIHRELSPSDEKDYVMYFKGISPEVIKEIIELYQIDFSLYNYKVPEYLKKKITRK